MSFEKHFMNKDARKRHAGEKHPANEENFPAYNAPEADAVKITSSVETEAKEVGEENSPILKESRNTVAGNDNYESANDNIPPSQKEERNL